MNNNIFGSGAFSNAVMLVVLMFLLIYGSTRVTRVPVITELI